MRIQYSERLPCKSYVMLLKMHKMTPQYLKQLPGDEHTGESQLPCGEYTGNLNSSMVSTLWSLDFLVYLLLAS
jgi:hypothetical protein